MKVDQARFHAQRLAATAGLTMADLDLEARARCRADMGWTVRLCREASDIVQSASGANAVAMKDPLQRVLRDMQVISVHSLLLPSNYNGLESAFDWAQVRLVLYLRRTGGMLETDLVKVASVGGLVGL